MRDTFDCYAVRIEINVRVELLLFTLKDVSILCLAENGQPPVIVESNQNRET